MSTIKKQIFILLFMVGVTILSLFVNVGLYKDKTKKIKQVHLKNNIIEIVKEKIVSPIIKDTEKHESVAVCNISSGKSYMDGKMITDTSSKQYQLLQTMNINEQGLYITNDGYIAIAMGSFYGEVGNKYILTFDTGMVLKVIKAEAKSDNDVINGCYHATDGSIIEFVIDEQIAGNYYGYSKSGYIDILKHFGGSVIKIVKVSE